MIAECHQFKTTFCGRHISVSGKSSIRLWLAASTFTRGNNQVFFAFCIAYRFLSHLNTLLKITVIIALVIHQVRPHWVRPCGQASKNGLLSFIKTDWDKKPMFSISELLASPLHKYYRLWSCQSTQFRVDQGPTKLSAIGQLSRLSAICPVLHMIRWTCELASPFLFYLT